MIRLSESMLEAIRSVAIAIGISEEAAKRQFEQAEAALQLAEKVNSLARLQKRLLRDAGSKQSRISPYAKFDKYHKKRRKWNRK